MSTRQKISSLLCFVRWICLLISFHNSSRPFDIVQGKDKHFDLPMKKKTDICTIMYTSGTTGDPKGVMISNNSIVTLIAGVQRLLGSVDQSVITQLYLSLLVIQLILQQILKFQILLLVSNVRLQFVSIVADHQ